MSSDDPFWKLARGRVVHWSATAIRLAGFQVSGFSLLELLGTAPLSIQQLERPRFQSGYFYKCMDNALRRKDAGQLTVRHRSLLDACTDFWFNEFGQLGDRTRSCITFELKGKLEQVVHGDRYGIDLKQIGTQEELDWQDWEFF